MALYPIRVVGFHSLTMVNNPRDTVVWLFPSLDAKDSISGSLPLKAISNLEVRFRKPLFGGGVIVDGNEVLLLLASTGEKLGVWSDEVGLELVRREGPDVLNRVAKKHFKLTERILREAEEAS